MYGTVFRSSIECGSEGLGMIKRRSVETASRSRRSPGKMDLGDSGAGKPQATRVNNAGDQLELKVQDVKSTRGTSELQVTKGQSCDDCLGRERRNGV